MAIVQVSRITHRSGLGENLPQLAGAELGWAIDERRLFIGNGTLQNGAPVIGNTEILTEFSDIFNIAGRYTYKGEHGGYTVVTGTSASSPVLRSLQDKLDEFASVLDFGAKGDGETDDTAAINRALYELFCRESNQQVRRSLFFPAGTYKVSNTINIPAFAKLYGEGARSSIISQVSGNSPVACTADSRQQTGINIGNNSATTPQHITIDGIGFVTTQAVDVFVVDQATQIAFVDTNFAGPFSKSNLTNAGVNIACVRLTSNASNITKQVTFDRCGFSNSTYGINSNQQIQGITVTKSQFDTLYNGVVLADITPINGGPTGVRVTENLFDNIGSSGIIIGAIRNNLSGYNIFLDVANGFQDSGSPTDAIITIGHDDNVTVGDMFSRNEDDNYVHPRIKLDGYRAFAIDNGQRLKFGRYVRGAGVEVYLTNRAVATTMITLNTNEAVAWTMNYRFQDDLTFATRVGTLTILGKDSLGNLRWNDQYLQNEDTNLVISAVQTDNYIYIQYTLTGEGFFRYSTTNFG
jgi:hypothetical protein